jgi:hypothetical protein
MPRSSCVLAIMPLLAAACVVAASSAVAKHRSSAAAKPSIAAKHKSSVAVKKHRSAAAKKQKSKKQKSSVVAAKEEPLIALRSRTPLDKHDCIAVAQAVYKQAGTLSRRTKQTIPREFERVISKLDEFCGEEEFEKARISIDWMNTCLQNFSNKTEFCSRNGSYFCAVDPESDSCLERDGGVPSRRIALQEVW